MYGDIPIFQDSSLKKHSFDHLPLRKTQLGASLETIRLSPMGERFKYFSSNHKLCHGVAIHHLPKSSNSMQQQSVEWRGVETLVVSPVYSCSKNTKTRMRTPTEGSLVLSSLTYLEWCRSPPWRWTLLERKLKTVAIIFKFLCDKTRWNCNFRLSRYDEWCLSSSSSSSSLGTRIPALAAVTIGSPDLVGLGSECHIPNRFATFPI